MLSDTHIHYGIVVLLVITVILLSIHVKQMYAAEGYQCILGQAANTNSVQDMVSDLEHQNLRLQGINKRNAGNIRDNDGYYGNNSKSDFVKGDYFVGDNNSDSACNNSNIVEGYKQHRK